MKKLFILLAFIGLVSCRKDNVTETKVLDFKEFQLTVPQDWRAFSLQGIDSKVGGVTNGRDSLVYDYGWYSYRLQNETSTTHDRLTLTLDDRPALLVRPQRRGQGVVGVYVEVGGLTKFGMTGQNLREEEEAVRIMKSVDFD